MPHKSGKRKSTRPLKFADRKSAGPTRRLDLTAREKRNKLRSGRRKTGDRSATPSASRPLATPLATRADGQFDQVQPTATPNDLVSRLRPGFNEFIDKLLKGKK